MSNTLGLQKINNKTKQSILWYTILPFLIHLIRFANSIILARILSPSDFGIVGLLSIILFYCDSFSNFGFGAALIQRKIITEKHLHSFFSFNFFVSVIFVILAQLFAPLIASFFNTPDLQNALPVYSLLFIISSFAMIPTVKLKRSLNFKSLAIFDTLKICISMPISLTLAINGYGFWSIIIAGVCAQFFITLMLLYKSDYFPSFQLHTASLKELFSFSSWSFTNAQLKLLNENIDKLIIGKFLGVEILGFYEKAIGLSKMPYEQISIRIANVSFSSLSRLQGQQTQLSEIFQKINKLNTIIMPPIFLGIAWVSEPFVLFLLGDKWQLIIPSMQILSIAFLLNSLANPFISINYATAHIKQQTIIRGGLLGLLITSLLLTVDYGIEIVAANLLIFCFLLLCLSITLLVSYMRGLLINILAIYFKVAIPLCIMMLTLVGTDKLFVIDTHWLYLIIHSIIGFCVYFIAILLIPFQEFNFIRNKIQSKFRKLFKSK